MTAADPGRPSARPGDEAQPGDDARPPARPGSGVGGVEIREGYFHDIARARYVIRRLFRIFDEHARSVGLEGLQHQALIQIAGRDDGAGVSVSSLAHWLDIPPALASRQVGKLHDLGLVRRGSLKNDKRVTAVSISAAGRETLAQISRDVVVDMRYFQYSMAEDDRRAALMVFLTYVGVPLDDDTQTAIDMLVQRASVVGFT